MECKESELPSWEEVDSFIRNEVGLQDFDILDENMCQLVKSIEWQNYPFEAAIVQERGGANIIHFFFDTHTHIRLAPLQWSGVADITPDAGIIDAVNSLLLHTPGLLKAPIIV